MDCSDSCTVENHWDLQHCILPHTGLCSISDHFPVLPEAKTRPLQRAKPQGTSTLLKNKVQIPIVLEGMKPRLPPTSILTVLWPLGRLGLPLWQGGELSSLGKTAPGKWQIKTNHPALSGKAGHAGIVEGINYSLGSSQVTLCTASAKPLVILENKVIKRGL